MDEFKKNSSYVKYIVTDSDDMMSVNQKKWGRRAARRKLKSEVWDLWSEHLFWSNEQLWNTWDDEEDFY